MNFECIYLLIILNHLLIINRYITYLKNANWLQVRTTTVPRRSIVAIAQHSPHINCMNWSVPLRSPIIPMSIRARSSPWRWICPKCVSRWVIDHEISFYLLADFLLIVQSKCRTCLAQSIVYSPQSLESSLQSRKLNNFPLLFILTKLSCAN